MKIRAGYEISYDCSQPTPMILTLSVYPSRTPDLLSWDRMRLDPAIPVNTYHDSFGNFCHVIRAPAGRFTVSTDFLIQDNGEPDPIAPQAEQLALENLPVDALISICSAAAIAKRTVCRKSLGPCLGRSPRDGRSCKRSATSFTIALRSVTSMLARPKQRGMPIQSGVACVGTLPISPSLFAAA
jgi:hypothetical protein